MEVLPGGGGGGGGTDIQVISSSDAFRVNNDLTETLLTLITAYSKTYGVTFSFFVLRSEFEATGAENWAGIFGTAVDAVCGYQHVQAFRTEQDQDRSRLLYNFAVITVGTDDLAFTTDVSRRMDLLDTPETFGEIDKAWALLVKSGAGQTAPIG